MKKFDVVIPLSAVEIIEIEAENEEHAIELVAEAIQNGEHEFEFDPEDIGSWWAE